MTEGSAARTVDLSISVQFLQYGGLWIVGVLTWWLRAPL